MTTTLRSTLVAMVAGIALLGAACSDDSDTASDEETTTTEESTTTEAEESTETTMAGDEEMDTSTMSIAEIASGNEDFSTLVSLVTAAGLAETLSGEGTFTVFAPTNDAFAKLDPAVVESLQADPQGALKDVLTLHVLPEEVDAAAATSLVGQCATTVNGGQLKIEQSGEDLLVGGAKVTSTDIQANNGVIHVIDTVIAEPNC